MKSFLLKLSPLVIVLTATSAFAQAKRPNEKAAETKPTEPALAEQMQGLSSSITKSNVGAESLYVVQDRARPLDNSVELTLGVGRNFNSSVYVMSTENNAHLRYFFNSRIYAAVYGAMVYNSLTNSGKDLLEDNNVFPDTAYVTKRYDFGLGSNLIYGKARITSDMIFYFDQFLTLGGGMVEQENDQGQIRTPVVMADTGFSFWFGRYMTAKIGVHAQNFEEKRIRTASRVTHLVGYSSVGVVL